MHRQPGRDTAVRLQFAWDPAKAEGNRRKHGVTFEDAMRVFADPLALSRLDEDHGGAEERWVTLGSFGVGRLLLVVHLQAEVSGDVTAIRIISARRATKREARQYEEG